MDAYGAFGQEAESAGAFLGGELPPGALELATNDVERAFLEGRLRELAP